MTRRALLGAGITGGVSLLAGGAIWWWQKPPSLENSPLSRNPNRPGNQHTQNPTEPILTSYADLMGCLYTSPEDAPLANAGLRNLALPDFPGRNAVWGAHGRDNRGHIWVGVSCSEGDRPSAHLMEFEPNERTFTDRGNAVEELQRAGIVRTGEGQMKIHSRIVQGEDGHLYFTSMDEQGENSNGSQLPTWGSHFWRLRLPERRWEHLRAVPEALIAVAGAGRWIYALGYFGHVVYQYDLREGEFRSTTIGSLGGHISRNLIVDIRGHVFVPRMRRSTAGDTILTTLVELDNRLTKLAEHPLSHYTQTLDAESHGLTAFQPMADRSIVFTTDQGRLYHIMPASDQPAEIRDLGWFHPRGRAYVASLFTADGENTLMGFVGRKLPERPRNDWVVYDLHNRTSKAVPVSLRGENRQIIEGPVLYGSITRDNAGNCYLGGTHIQNGRFNPLFVQVVRRD